MNNRSKYFLYIKTGNKKFLYLSDFTIENLQCKSSIYLLILIDVYTLFIENADVNFHRFFKHNRVITC